MYSQLPHIPRPRLPMCVPPFVRQKKCHNSWPSRASIAHALSGVEKYKMPFTSRIDARMLVPPAPPAVDSVCATPPTIVGAPPRPPPPDPLATRLTHPSVRFFTFD